MTAIDMPDPGAARSFWLEEALRDDPGEPCPPLEANVVADVCIVGGGLAGLWTAVRLSEREPGLRIALWSRTSSAVARADATVGSSRRRGGICRR
ncbi:MAG: FAD-dependent oxidoreductase [Actinobacteria bacterium]|nr:MAG: FAD-dependent oxidoreductase [Actinomycetota bacterium]